MLLKKVTEWVFDSESSLTLEGWKPVTLILNKKILYIRTSLYWTRCRVGVGDEGCATCRSRYLWRRHVTQKRVNQLTMSCSSRPEGGAKSSGDWWLKIKINCRNLAPFPFHQPIHQPSSSCSLIQKYILKLQAIIQVASAVLMLFALICVSCVLGLSHPMLSLTFDFEIKDTGSCWFVSWSASTWRHNDWRAIQRVVQSH